MAIIDFLYCGEANLDTFLALADELKLKGLTGEGETNESDAKNPSPSVRDFQQQQKLLKGQVITYSEVPFKSQAERTVSVVKTVANAKSRGNFITRRNGKRVMPSFTCKVCGKEGMLQNIKRHIEAYHLDKPVAHPCNLCDKTSRTKCGLWKHKNKDHKKHL